jgi:hypothetical protein
MGKIITVAASKTRTRGSLTPDIGSVSKDVPGCRTFLENKDFAHLRISVDKPRWWSNRGQTHSQTKRIGELTKINKLLATDVAR